MRKINVLQVTNRLSIGGTEKTLQLYSEYLNKEIFNVIVCGLYEGGVRGELLKKKGFEVYVVKGNRKELIKLMKKKNIHILHVHRHAACDPFAIEAARDAGIPIIVETNIFGTPDLKPSAKFIDKIFLVSKMCAIRYKQWLKISWREFFRRHDVLYNPIDLSQFKNHKLSTSQIKEIRKQYGIPENSFVIGRHGRPSPSKWGNICIEMIPHLIKLIPNVKYLALGFPQKRMQKIYKMGLRDYFIFLEPTSDTKEVIKFLSLIDVFVHSSTPIAGESFGLVIAEAMACMKPVVCDSTPLADNAQVELIDYNKTGYIANNAKAYAEAVADLLLDKHKRQKMGKAAYLKVKENYEVRKNVQKIERIYLQLLGSKGFLVDLNLIQKRKSISCPPTQDEIILFEQDYKRRLRTCWGKPKYLQIILYERLLQHYQFYRLFAKIIHDLIPTIRKIASKGIKATK